MPARPELRRTSYPTSWSTWLHDLTVVELSLCLLDEARGGGTQLVVETLVQSLLLEPLETFHGLARSKQFESDDFAVLVEIGKSDALHPDRLGDPLIADLF